MTVRLDSKFSEQINTCEFRKVLNFAYGQGGLKLEINIPPQHILAKSKGRLIIEGGVSSSEYGIYRLASTIQKALTQWHTLMHMYTTIHHAHVTHKHAPPCVCRMETVLSILQARRVMTRQWRFSFRLGLQ